MKKLTAYVGAAGGNKLLLESPVATSSENIIKNTNTNAVAPAPAAAAAVPRGLDLLFAASQVEMPKHHGENGAEEVPSFTTTMTVMSSGTSTIEGKSASSDTKAKEDCSSECDAENSTAAADTLKNQHAKTSSRFPQVLQKILTTSEYQSIIHWLPDGLSFIIADKQRFSDEILPKYFGEALFRSFIRKLNRWGFRRVKKIHGGESSFAHNDFVREKPWLCLKMKCNSKPSYHKEVVSFAKNRKNRKAQQQQAVAEVMTTTTSHANAVIIPFPTLCMTTADNVSPTAAAIADSIPELQHCILHEMQQIIMLFQMRQRHHQRHHQLQLLGELQRLNNDNGMSSQHNNEEQFSNSSNSRVQSSMLARRYACDMLRRNNILQGEM